MSNTYRPRLPESFRPFIDAYQILPDDQKETVENSLPSLINKENAPSTYTYVFRSMHLYKIGSTDDVRVRFNRLTVNNPHDCEIICFSNMVNERYLQGLMNDYHVTGEWYQLPPEQILFIKGLMS